MIDWLKQQPTRVIAIAALVLAGWLANDLYGLIGQDAFKAHVAAEIARLETAVSVVATENESQRDSLVRIRTSITDLNTYDDQVREAIAVLKWQAGVE